MSRYLRIVLAAALLTSVFYIGCILDPKPDKNPPDLGPQKEFKPLTEKENVVYNLVLSYERTDITHYEELLHEDYIWKNQDRYVDEIGEEIFLREEDIRMVTNIFNAANGRPRTGQSPIDKLSLTIPVYDDPDKYWSAWTDTINGEPCEDCWQTTRPYELNVDIGQKTLHADDKIQLVIVPVIEGGVKKYKILRAYDLDI